MIKEFINEGNKDYCIAEVEQGKNYKVVIEVDNRLHFQYVISNDEHTQTLFMGSIMDKRGSNPIRFTHILPASKVGHLCVRSKTSGDGYWKNMKVNIEEV